MFEQLHMAAVLGAHLSASPERGFRASNIQFLFDLFWNWLSSTDRRSHLEDLHLTQVSRLIGKLKVEAWVTGDSKCLRLSNAGVLGILTRLRKESVQGESRLFDFYVYFASAYGKRILDLKDSQGRSFSLALREEVESLLDLKSLRERRREKLEGEIEYWRQRSVDTRKTIEFAREERANGAEWSEIVARLDQFFPYELKAQKPLSDLFKTMPTAWQEWEIITGNSLRMQQLWHNRILELEAQLKALKLMKIER